MDQLDFHPNCAICNAPPFPECPCERDRLSVALQQAESRILEKKLREIRDWVTTHAREQIVQSFNARIADRKTAHKEYLSRIRYYHLYMQYQGNPPLHPRQLQDLKAQVQQAELDLKRGIDKDWKISVQKYPEVLDYFYRLVQIRVPSERSSSVIETPFGVMPGTPDPRRAPGRGGLVGRAPPVAPAAPLAGGYTYI